MAANTNKNSASSAGDTEPAAKVGDGGQGTKLGRFRRPVITKKRLFLGLAVVAGLVAVAVLLTSVAHIGQKVYAEAAGHKIYKKDIESLQVVDGRKTGVTDHQAATVLADKYLSEAMAKQEGIKVTQVDIVAAYGSSINDQKKMNPYGYQNLVNQLYFSDLNEHNVGVYQGKLLVANFSRYVPYQSGLLAQQKAAESKLGDPAAIAQDKQYAQKFINNLYNQITAKKITFDQAIEMEHNDPVVGQNSFYSTQQHSGPFNGPIGQVGLLAAHSIRDKVTSMKAGTLSKPFVVRVSNSATDANSTAESYFLVVQMDKVSGGSNGMTFDQQLKQAKKQLGYKVNV